MSWRKYFVIKHQGGWSVLYEGRRSPPASDRAIAIQHALERAQDELIGASDQVVATVIVQEDETYFREYWTSAAGEDAA